MVRSILAVMLYLAVAAPAWAGEALVLNIDGAVSPATAEYAVRGLHRAAAEHDALVILKLDTPGGLDVAMRRIVREILASPVPVVGYVAPSGARAASAGTYILYATHVAAMAPATNLGAATPIQIGGERDTEPAAKRGGEGDTLKRKQIEDSAAYLRSLAQLRGRNVEWADRAVREAVSLPALDAKRLHVVDLVAQSIPDLLQQLQGREVTVKGRTVKLDTENAHLVVLQPDWRDRLLSVIADPNVALILMMLGIYGLIFEFANPGFVLPGVAGTICLLLALFAFQMLPINYVGLGLILLGVAFIVAEAFVPSFGALGLGGAGALIFGMVILIEPGVPGYGMPLPTLVTAGAVSAALVFGIVTLAVQARRRPVVSGREDLIGADGVVLGDMQNEGWARVHGENWRIVSRVPLIGGQAVRVTRLDGLTLSVEPKSLSRQGKGSRS